MATTLDTQIQAMLVNKAGNPKHRFSYKERLKLLDPTSSPRKTHNLLSDFRRIFAFRLYDAIITRDGRKPSSWTALRGRLKPRHVADHLLANRIPTKEPVWVGARGTGWVRWLCVDVDSDREIVAGSAARQQRRPFKDRIRMIEDAFRRMGIDPRKRNEVLVVKTPSGGRHYYLFLKYNYPIEGLAPLLEYAGLYQKKGEFEFFPSTKQGLRLPFGHVPGQPDRPTAWIDFIKRFKAKRIRLHLLPDLYTEVMKPREGAQTYLTKVASPQNKLAVINKTLILGIPKAARQKEVKDRQSKAPTVKSKINCFADAKRLWDAGITEAGTRTDILFNLAIHLIWFRHLTAEDTTQRLTHWALNPRHNSQDIQRDLAHGTDVVAKHIARICSWLAKHKKTTENPVKSCPKNGAQFTRLEIEALKTSLSQTPLPDRLQQAQFLLSMLNFCKRHGTSSSDNKYWTSSPSIRQVVRRWPGCHHMNYKYRFEQATNSGILELVKKHWHSPNGKGRACTYALKVTPDLNSPATFDFDTALGFLTESKPLVEPWVERSHNDENHDIAGAVNAEQPESTLSPSGGGREHGGEHSPPVHPPSPGISLETSSYQRDRESHAAARLSRFYLERIGSRRQNTRFNRDSLNDQRMGFEEQIACERARFAKLREERAKKRRRSLPNLSGQGSLAKPN